eukprot:m.603844 g.603844  ORF g.603844 m.603844 type:complete len:297 (-) comp22456_c0_seq14:1519-2409(-)
MLHALIAHVARDSVAPISYASYLFSTVLSRKPSSDCAYGSHTHLLVLTSCVGMPLMQVHWTSHLVHLTHLFDGSVQREQFSRLAQHNFFGLQVVPFGVMHKVASYNDVKVRLQDDSWSPAAIVIEIPQRMNGGATITFDDLRQLRSVCTRKGIHMHMDGARLWEAQPHYGRSISDICALFDSVYVSFYKGLGAMAGAMLCGSEAFVDAAREWRHRLGGQPFTFSPAWIDCTVNCATSLRNRSYGADIGEGMFFRGCDTDSHRWIWVESDHVNSGRKFTPHTDLLSAVDPIRIDETN